METYREKILEEAKPYYDQLDQADFSHNFDHVFRVERLAKRMAEAEGADMEIVEAASLLFDIARGLEDKGEVDDHALAGSEMARPILEKVGFPAEKVDAVCQAIRVHRKSQNHKPETLEAKIIQEADYLDGGAIGVARVIASSLQSNKYRRPIYVDKPYAGEQDKVLSAIHYLQYRVEHPKMQPEHFQTKVGKELAKKRFDFLKNFVEEFIKEWHGED